MESLLVDCVGVAFAVDKTCLNPVSGHFLGQIHAASSE
ncbi:hypothetical protein OCAR_7062 [Afipia carboxidovorans OM5]|nr:hypothetical protein OCAR_7062 [Afipia carboxidovorans OM5]